MAEPHSFAEPPLAGFQQRVAVGALQREEQSRFQHLEVLDTAPFGRMLVLDNAVQTTLVDEAAYHEMLVHVPLLAHPRPREVLIIGGGDGGALRRVLQHPVDHALQVEIDEAVIRVSRELMPEISAGAYDSPRATVIVGDGIAFLESHQGAFDAILIDSTDPVGPAEGLFSTEFYTSVRRALRVGGVMASHCGSPWLMAEGWLKTIATLEGVFSTVEPYLAYIPAYPGGLWGMVAASESHSVRQPLMDRIAELDGGLDDLSYYTPDLHRASFALPARLARRQPLFAVQPPEPTEAS
ncbi:MAG: polyamine aminopropyltransferase [Chloroflexota bacterium]